MLLQRTLQKPIGSMQTLLRICVLMLVLTSCADGETSTKAKVDSTVNTIDSAAKDIYKSAKEEVKDIKEHLDSTFDKKFDEKK